MKRKSRPELSGKKEVRMNQARSRPDIFGGTRTNVGGENISMFTLVTMCLQER